ncbi:hypothetical protein PSP6_270111 [Paraburkholderia tropica]|nr:hypothetical protein PSP6_270111 [Paraburkholderia tropica]
MTRPRKFSDLRHIRRRCLRFPCCPLTSLAVQAVGQAQRAEQRFISLTGTELLRAHRVVAATGQVRAAATGAKRHRDRAPCGRVGHFEDEAIGVERDAAAVATTGGFGLDLVFTRAQAKIASDAVQKAARAAREAGIALGARAAAVGVHDPVGVAHGNLNKKRRGASQGSAPPRRKKAGLRRRVKCVSA